MGHARALVNIDSAEEQINVLNQILNETLSVRKTEELAKEKKAGSKTPHNSSVMPLSLVDKKLKTSLSSHFDVPVKFQRKDVDKGRIVIPFNSDDDLERIIKLLDL